MGFPPSPVVYNEAIQEDFFSPVSFLDDFPKQHCNARDGKRACLCVYVLAIVTYSTLLFYNVETDQLPQHYIFHLLFGICQI